MFRQQKAVLKRVVGVDPFQHPGRNYQREGKGLPSLGVTESNNEVDKNLTFGGNETTTSLDKMRKCS